MVLCIIGHLKGRLGLSLVKMHAFRKSIRKAYQGGEVKAG
jgi:ribosomal protein S5